MLAWLEDLTPPASWRDAEERVMALFADLLEGRIPTIPAAAGFAACRRMGYLLDLAARRSEPPIADRLAAAARATRVQLEAQATPEQEALALIGPPGRQQGCGDDVARRWGLTGGLDLDRFETWRAARAR